MKVGCPPVGVAGCGLVALQIWKERIPFFLIIAPTGVHLQKFDLTLSDPGFTN